MKLKKVNYQFRYVRNHIKNKLIDLAIKCYKH